MIVSFSQRKILPKNNIQTIFFVLLILIATNLYSQTLKEKIGQMIWAGFSTSKLDDSVKIDLQKRNIGGIILYAWNITSPSQVKSLTNEIKSYSKTPPFIAVDQEGGYVARLNTSTGFKNTYSAYTLGTVINKEDTTRQTASMMADWLEQSGFNVNLAPVVDVNVNPNSPAIGKLGRSFSSKPDSVYLHARWFIDEFNKKNIITCLKHFPGHGSAAQDSHLGFTDITNTWADSELIPYTSLISKGYDGMIMIGHLFNQKIDPVYPASLSHNAISNLLRSQLGFNGLIITDAMNMQAITANYSFENSIEYAVNAGEDILLYNSALRNGTSLAGQIINIIEQKVNQGRILVSRIDDAYNRIIQTKTKMGIITSVNQIASSPLPDEFALYQNYPNPFNTQTIISYRTAKSAKVTLKVFDVLGREIVTLIDQEIPQGIHQILFDASGLSSGIYFYKLTADNFTQIKKLILIK